jgi:ComF family protein
MKNIAAKVWNDVRERALDLLFVRACLSCAATLPESSEPIALCDDCLAEVPPVDWPTCRRCAAELPEYPGSMPTCFRCESDKLRFDATLSLGHYEGWLKESILRMKTDGSEQWGQMFAQLMVDRYGDEIKSLEADAIVPIPSSPWNQFTRRTNGPTVLARALGQRLRIPVMSRLLKRSNQLAPQRELSRAGRFRNVRGGYQVRKGYRLDSPHTLLVDDVLTTGATCSEAARILKRAGAARVTVIVVARTPNS